VAAIRGLAEALRRRIPSVQQLTAVDALLCLSEGWELISYDLGDSKRWTWKEVMSLAGVWRWDWVAGWGAAVDRGAGRPQQQPSFFHGWLAGGGYLLE
jgi:hypothetical protein